MEGAALPGRLSWRVAKVVEVVDETARVRSLVLDVPDWPGHQAGQHVDIRLTAADGYQAQRSYSIASAPEDDRLVLTVERLEEGEVSPYLFDVLTVGDELELRGPIGGYFVWTPALGGPILLIAGGSGVVPFRSMLRHRTATQTTIPRATALLGALHRRRHLSRRTDDVSRRTARTSLYTLTREWPSRMDRLSPAHRHGLLREVAWTPAERPLMYVCGPSGFVESAANALVALGHDASEFEPSGSDRRERDRCRSGQ